MYRLTTPSHVFYMDIDPREWDKFIVSYKSEGKIVLEKTEQDEYEMEEIETEEPDRFRYKLAIKLTQEETKLFKPLGYSEVQIRCHYGSGDVLASEKIKFKIDDVLNQSIMY